MSDHTRCKVCRMTHFKDEPCPQCSGGAERVSSETREQHIPYTGPLPSKDPYVQDYREKRGRVAQEDLYPECDPLPNERR